MGNVIHVPGIKRIMDFISQVFFLASLDESGRLTPKHNIVNVVMCEAKKILSQYMRVLYNLRMECGIIRIVCAT